MQNKRKPSIALLYLHHSEIDKIHIICLHERHLNFLFTFLCLLLSVAVYLSNSKNIYILLTFMLRLCPVGTGP